MGALGTVVVVAFLLMVALAYLSGGAAPRIYGLEETESIALIGAEFRIDQL